MSVVKIVHWQDGGFWIGYLQEYPDYWTQGKTLADLKDHLKDLYKDISSGTIPGIRKVEDLVVT
jgi:hypothetical protein